MDLERMDLRKPIPPQMVNKCNYVKKSSLEGSQDSSGFVVQWSKLQIFMEMLETRVRILVKARICLLKLTT